MNKGIIYLLLFCLCFAEVNAVGLSSYDLLVNIDFEPNLQRTFHYRVVPFSSSPIDVKLYVTDETEDGTSSNFSKYVTLSDKEFKGIRNSNEPFFSAVLKLPPDVSEPGYHKIHIGVWEVPKNSGGIGVTTAAEAILRIFVPYEGKYLKYNLNAKSVNQGTPLDVSLQLYNSGTIRIERLYSRISLIDFMGNIVNERTTDTIAINSLENKELNITFPTDSLQSGKYKVRAEINYDGLKETTEKEVRIGELNFNIINYTREMFTGKINEILVDVESNWAEQVNDVYAEISLAGRSVRTMSENFIGFQRKNLTAFFDTNGIKPGKYNMTVTLHFGDKKISKTSEIRISGNFVEILSDLTLENTTFLIALVIIIIINFILLVALVKKKDEHEKDKR